jgi:hypothetical protein
VKLIYSAIASLDGYTEDRTGAFDWAAPDEAVHAFVNDLERPVGTYLYGRRMYETMVYWETAHELPDPSAAVRDFTEIWQVLLGGGKRSLPRDVRADLELLDSRRFDSGVVFRRYAVSAEGRP